MEFFMYKSYFSTNCISYTKFPMRLLGLCLSSQWVTSRGQCAPHLFEQDFFIQSCSTVFITDKISRNSFTSSHVHRAVFPLAIITTKCASIPLICRWILSLSDGLTQSCFLYFLLSVEQLTFWLILIFSQLSIDFSIFNFIACLRP